MKNIDERAYVKELGIKMGHSFWETYKQHKPEIMKNFQNVNNHCANMSIIACREFLMLIAESLASPEERKRFVEVCNFYMKEAIHQVSEKSE